MVWSENQPYKLGIEVALRGQKHTHNYSKVPINISRQPQPPGGSLLTNNHTNKLGLLTGAWRWSRASPATRGRPGAAAFGSTVEVTLFFAKEGRHADGGAGSFDLSSHSGGEVERRGSRR
jgi:hypothetical protein